jgi:hypothetical protein
VRDAFGKGEVQRGPVGTGLVPGNFGRIVLRIARRGLGPGQLSLSGRRDQEAQTAPSSLLAVVNDQAGHDVAPGDLVPPPVAVALNRTALVQGFRLEQDCQGLAVAAHRLALFEVTHNDQVGLRVAGQAPHDPPEERRPGTASRPSLTRWRPGGCPAHEGPSPGLTSAELGSFGR